MFSEHLFLRTPLGGCFCFENNFTGQFVCFQCKLVIRNSKNKTKELQKNCFRHMLLYYVLYGSSQSYIFGCFNRVPLLQNFTKDMKFKGYLHYKTIISQIASSEAQVKNFLFRRKVMFCSQDIQVFVFLTISWFSKPATSWWV